MDLHHLMISGLNKDIWCHVCPYCSKQYSAQGDNGNIMREGGREVGGFGQFNDTMSQYGHSVSCMTILLKKV